MASSGLGLGKFFFKSMVRYIHPKHVQCIHTISTHAHTGAHSCIRVGLWHVVVPELGKTHLRACMPTYICARMHTCACAHTQ